jgi:hypothetical protein
MLLTLALRQLFVRPVRALVLLLGFSVGVGVMIVLLSVGEAMLEQSRDVALVGGGEVTVLPQGIDVEAMRTGGVSGMFFGIDRARFVGRQLLGGPRHAGVVRAVAPAIEGKLLYLSRGRRTLPVLAGGEIPSGAAAVGAPLDVRAGRWADVAADSAWLRPSRQQLYDELDHFHLPAAADSSWAEWHYFNVEVAPDEWWYVTFLLGGAVSLDPAPGARWGGRLLVTRRRPDGRYERFSSDVPPGRITFDTARADLALGESSVQQRDGTYHVRARAGSGDQRLFVNLVVRAEPHRYFPPVELRADDFVSGYVVPALRAAATGRLCVGGRCRHVEDAPAYHDHNWGVWEAVTWEWGAARGRELSLLYGGVYGPSGGTGAAPFFLTVIDSLGVRQVLRFSSVRYEGARAAEGAPGRPAPERFSLVAVRGADSLRLRGVVEDAAATRMAVGDFSRYFLQMRARFRLEGHIAGAAVADSGRGFFETYVDRGRASGHP